MYYLVLYVVIMFGPFDPNIFVWISTLLLFYVEGYVEFLSNRLQTLAQ